MERENERGMYLIGAITVLLILIKFLLDVIIGVLIRPFEFEPQTVLDWYAVFQHNAIFGLFRLSLLDMVWMILLVPFYYLLFRLLSRQHSFVAATAFYLGLIGITCYIANNNAVTMLNLATAYNNTQDSVTRERLLVAGESVLSNGMGTGVIVGAVLVVTAGLLFTLLMLWDKTFFRITPIFGIAAHVAGFFAIWSHSALYYLPFVSLGLLGIVAIMYLGWYVTIGLMFLKKYLAPLPDVECRLAV